MLEEGRGHRCWESDMDTDYDLPPPSPLPLPSSPPPPSLLPHVHSWLDSAKSQEEVSICVTCCVVSNSDILSSLSLPPS